MPQKSKVLVCDRPFKCPVCRRDFVIGDEIILLLPQRTRYCSPCGTNAINRINGRSEPGYVPSSLRDEINAQSAQEASPVVSKPLTAQTKDAAAPTMTQFLQFVDKSMAAIVALEKRCTALEKQVADHEEKLDGYELPNI